MVFIEITGQLLSRVFNKLSKKFQGNFKRVSRKFQGYFKIVSWVFQGGLKVFLREISVSLRNSKIS